MSTSCPILESSKSIYANQFLSAEDPSSNNDSSLIIEDYFSSSSSYPSYSYSSYSSKMRSSLTLRLVLLLFFFLSRSLLAVMHYSLNERVVFLKLAFQSLFNSQIKLTLFSSQSSSFCLYNNQISSAALACLASTSSSLFPRPLLLSVGGTSQL